MHRYKKILVSGFFFTVLLFLVFTAITQTGYKPKESVDQHATANSDEEYRLTTDDPWEELKNIVAVYSSDSRISYSGKIDVIDDNTDTEKIVESHDFHYTIEKDQYYYSLAGIEVIQKTHLLIVVDHLNRSISCSPVQQQSNTPGFNITDFKKLMQEVNAAARVTASGNYKVLTIDSIDHPDIQGYQITYDPKTYKIKRMLIGIVKPFSLNDTQPEAMIYESYDGNSTKSGPTENTDESTADISVYYYYLDVKFDKIKTEETADGFHPEKKYVIIDKSTIKLTDQYKDYQLIKAFNE